MKGLHAVFENGIFRPIDRVDLPEHSEVLIDVRPFARPEEDRSRRTNGEWDEVYEILSRSHTTGEPDLAARHDEPQP